MRANPDQVYAPVDYSDVPSSGTKDCKENTCSTTEMSEYDITLWKCMINPNDSSDVPYSICTTLLATFGNVSSLPEGEAEIQIAGDVQTVRVRWVDDSAGTKRGITLITRTDR
jgi:hypothetical protein